MSSVKQKAVVDGGEYPRVLDREGCLYGQATQMRLSEMLERIEVVERKIDRLTSALVGASITFGTAALMLGLNLWIK